MSNVAFDTLKLSRKLESAGFTRDQAVGAAEALAETMDDNVATKSDLREVKNELSSDIRDVETRLTGQIRLIQWMLALVIAVTVLLLLKDIL